MFFGTTNLDLCFNVERLPTPGESLMGTLTRHPGGKGANQAVAAARLGLRPHFYTRLGDDDAGHWLLQSLTEAGVCADAIKIAPGEVSGSALVMVGDDGTNMIVIDPGANLNVTPQMIENAAEFIQHNAIVVAEMGMPIGALNRLFELKQDKGFELIFNPAPVRSGLPSTAWSCGRLMDYKIGIISLPIYVILVALLAILTQQGQIKPDAPTMIAVLVLGGFSCAELGRRLPVLRNIGAAAIFAAFIPSALVYYKLIPAPIEKSIIDFTKFTNFLYVYFAAIIVGSILGMDRNVLIKGFLKIFVPLSVGSVAAAAVGTLVGTMLGLVPTRRSSSSWCRSWRAVSAKVRSRSLSAMQLFSVSRRATSSPRCFRP